MIIYTGVHGSKEVLDKLRYYHCGIMISSTYSTSIPQNEAITGIPLALDNGAFMAHKHGYPFDKFAFEKTLSKCVDRKLPLDFVVAPDIVAGGLCSLNKSLAWVEHDPSPLWALAVQDGIKPSHLWGDIFKKFSCVFVGGSIEWKWQTADEWVKVAHDNGLKCHIGRASTIEQLRRVAEMGADSCDSTVFVRNGRWDILEEFTRDKPTQTVLSL